MNRLRVARRIDQDAARGLVLGYPAKALAQPFMEDLIEALEPVGRDRSSGGSGQPDLDWQVEDQRQIGSKTAEGKVVQSGKRIKRKPPAVALIGKGRIG